MAHAATVDHVFDDIHFPWGVIVTRNSPTLATSKVKKHQPGDEEGKKPGRKAT